MSLCPSCQATLPSSGICGRCVLSRLEEMDREPVRLSHSRQVSKVSLATGHAHPAVLREAQPPLRRRVTLSPTRGPLRAGLGSPVLERKGIFLGTAHESDFAGRQGAGAQGLEKFGAPFGVICPFGAADWRRCPRVCVNFADPGEGGGPLSPPSLAFPLWN